MVTNEDKYDTINLLFDSIIFPKHDELSKWKIDEETDTLLLWLDMNQIDFTMSDIIDFDTYGLLEEEYDHYTSDAIYDTITSEIRDTVKHSLKLINTTYRIEFVFYC